MRVSLQNLIRRSQYIGILSAFALGAAIFSGVLFIPDFVQFANKSNTVFTEEINEKVIELLLAVILALLAAAASRSLQVQKKLLSVIETLPYSILMFDSNGKMITANRLGRCVIDQLNFDTRLNYTQFIRSICEHNVSKAKNANCSLLNALESNESLFQDIIYCPNGKVYFLQCQETWIGERIVLITETTKLYEITQQAQTLLSAIELSPSGFALTKLSGRSLNLFYNNTAYNQITLQKLNSLFDENEWNNICDTLNKIEPHSTETTVLDDTKKTKWLSLQFFPFEMNGETIVLILANDRTEQKMRDTQSQQSARLETMGHLAGGVAHDFNNILSIIQGYLKLDKRDNTTREQHLEYNTHMLKAIQRGSSLTKQLLSFGRNKINSVGDTDLVSHMHDMEGFMATLIHSSAKVKFTLPENVRPIIDCPPDICTQIIMNLAVNARDAMPQGGEINISADLAPRDVIKNILSDTLDYDRDYIAVKVSDTGTGISPEHIKNIFDPFFTTKDTGKGTGLGLSLVYRHVQNLHGHIDVASKVGTGTTFTVYLPLNNEKSETKPLTETFATNNVISLKDKVVLLAEDEPDLRSILKSFLEDEGCLVYDAGNGVEALSKQDELDRVDFLITDVMMPEMNGLRLAEIMADIHPECRTIFISGYPKGGDLAMVNIPESSLFITKPIDADVLIKIMTSTSGFNASNEIETWTIEKKETNHGVKGL